MFFSIDRFEGKTAVLIGEDRKTLDVPRSMLPEGAKPGQMLRYENKAFMLDEQKTKERREQVADILGRLLHKGDE